MEMATFVYVGEYSSACACRLRYINEAAPLVVGAPTRGADAPVSQAAATAGVIAQDARRRAAANSGVIGALIIR
jgi:hypothetical protein